MHRYINYASLNVDVLDVMNKRGDSLRDFHTAQRNSSEDNLFELWISLSDFVRNPSKHATNFLRVHYQDSGWRILFWLVHAFPWRPRGIALKEKIRRRTFRCAPPSFAALASWSDVSRSNQAKLSQSRCLCRLFRFQSTCVSKSPLARQGIPCRALNP